MPKKKETTAITTPVPEPTLSSSERIEQTSSINGQAFTAGIIRQVQIQHARETARSPMGYLTTDAEDWARVFSACRAYLDQNVLPIHEKEKCRLSLANIMRPFTNLYDPQIWAQKGKVDFLESSLPLLVALYVFDEHHYAYAKAYKEAQIAEWKQKQAEKKEAEEEQSVGEE